VPIGLQNLFTVDLPLTIVRPFNTYGPRQSARAFIPTVITQLLSGKKEINIGSLEPTRDMNFVTDVVQGFISIAQSGKTTGEEINIASQSEISMGDTAKKIMEIMNIEAELITDQQRIRPDKSEVYRLLGSNEKIKELTSWQSRTTLQEGLAKTIEWIKKNPNSYKPHIYNI